MHRSGVHAGATDFLTPLYTVVILKVHAIRSTAPAKWKQLIILFQVKHLSLNAWHAREKICYQTIL